MIKATKIRMHAGREEFNSVLEMESIYLIGLSNQPEGFYSKESIHDFVKDTQNRSIHVAATNGNQKYVRSAPNDTPEDNLLKLPQEK